MSTLLTPGRAVKWIGDDGGWKTGKELDRNWYEEVSYVQAPEGVYRVSFKRLESLALRSEYEAAE